MSSAFLPLLRTQRLLILILCLLCIMMLFITFIMIRITSPCIAIDDSCAVCGERRAEAHGRPQNVGIRLLRSESQQTISLQSPMATTNSTTLTKSNVRNHGSLVRHPVDGIEQFKLYIDPPSNIPNYGEKAGEKAGKILSIWPGNHAEPKFLKDEYSTVVKKDMYMAVMTSQEYLPIRAVTLYATWGKEVENLFFYVGEDCVVPDHLSYLPIVKLKGISDREYPPLRKAFAVLQYMYEHHLDEYNWFVRADDDMYVRTKNMAKLLHKLNPYENIYLGRAGTGRPEHVTALKLLPHERFCMGGPGIFLSTGAMMAAGPHLNNCLNAVLYHNNHSEWKWDYDDVEIGRCLSRKLNIQCSSSLETLKYFVYDYSKKSLDAQSLWTTPSFRDLITLHPVKDPNNMKIIHHFYQTLEFREKQNEVRKLTSDLNELCRSLPNNFLPPNTKEAPCKPRMHGVPWH